MDLTIEKILKSTYPETQLLLLREEAKIKKEQEKGK